MRDTTKDTGRISDIWRWIHNNIPGEPSTSDDVQDVVIRLLKEGQEAKSVRDEDAGEGRDGSQHQMCAQNAADAQRIAALLAEDYDVVYTARRWPSDDWSVFYSYRLHAARRAAGEVGA